MTHRPAVDPEVLRAAGRVLYVSALYAPHHRGRPGVQAKKCVGCGKLVAISVPVHRDRLRQAAAAGRTLEIACHGCGADVMENTPVNVVSLPSSDEIAGR